MSLSERQHYTSELLRFAFVNASNVLSDGQIHNLYYGMLSEVMDGPSPSFSPEMSPIEIAPDSVELFSSQSSRTSDIQEMAPVGRSTPASTMRDILDLAAAAERAAVATEEIAPRASNALASLAQAASVLAGMPNNARNGNNPSIPVVDTSTSQQVCGASPSAARGASTSASSSPYYGTEPTCVVCMDEMITPGVTDGACDHRSTCTPCLRRILFYARGQAQCVLCREPYYRVYWKTRY